MSPERHNVRPSPAALPGGVLTPLEWGKSLSGAPIASGWPIDQVLVRRWRGVAADIEQPALDHHYVTLHLGGTKRIRRDGEGAQALGDVALGAYSLSPAGSAFSWRTEGPVDFAHIYLRPAQVAEVIVAEFDRDPRTVSLHDALGARDPLVEALLATAEAGVTQCEAAGKLYWEGLMHTLIYRVLKLHSDLDRQGAPAPHVLAPHRARAVMAFVEETLGQDIGLSELAAVAGVSPFHFTRGFKRHTGRSPYAYLIHRRLERAKVLLQGDLTIGAVAQVCGFRTHSQFSAHFRRAAGIPPGRYRALH